MSALTSLRVVIVEDEEPQRRQLAGWLEREPEVIVVGEAGNGPLAIRVVDDVRPDVLLLDVSLPELSGLEVLDRIHHTPEVVFTTAFRDYALQAFELGAADYLLKPFGPDRLLAALRRVRDRIAERTEADVPMSLGARVASVRDEGQPLARLFVRDRNAIVPVPVETIVRLEADGDYTAVIAAGRRHLVGVSLHALHERIRRPDFVRVHRQHVINLAHVARFVSHDPSRLRIEFAGGGSIVASRAGSQLLRGLVE